ncbi:hypothetical protein T492DRAFT_927891, partial [Pavlovales sp. CCMP2436]
HALPPLGLLAARRTHSRPPRRSVNAPSASSPHVLQVSSPLGARAPGLLNCRSAHTLSDSLPLHALGLLAARRTRSRPHRHTRSRTPRCSALALSASSPLGARVLGPLGARPLGLPPRCTRSRSSRRSAHALGIRAPGLFAARRTRSRPPCRSAHTISDSSPLGAHALGLLAAPRSRTPRSRTPRRS